MSLFGTLNTSVAGMNAQASKLGTIGDNIANSSTTGYKDASAEFETLLGVQTPGSYQSGGVSTQVRYAISGQGDIDSGQTAVSNMAISGSGFFAVQSPQGGIAMTRAGDFVPNASGQLINTAGYTLLGYSLTDGTTPAANGTTGLVPVKLTGLGLSAAPSTTGSLSVNLPSSATAVASFASGSTTTALPSENKADSTYTDKTSLNVYDDLGNKKQLDVYMTKTGTDTATGDTKWEVSIYDNSTANASTGGFPYSSAALTTQTIEFSPTDGTVASGGSLSLNIPGGKTLSLDMSKSTQLAADYAVSSSTVDGNAPSQFDHFAIANDGTVSTVYTSGTSVATYRIPLANVQSPDNMTALPGNVYQANAQSGDMLIGIPLTGKLGEIESNSLEESTVDIATELTSMIAAQRGYQANSQVLQTSSDLLGVLNNIHS